MSYKQSMKHHQNHRKDKYFQQCAFSFSDTKIKSEAAIAEETAEKYIVKNVMTGDFLSEYFDTEDKAVDFIRQANYTSDVGVYTDKGLCIAKI